MIPELNPQYRRYSNPVYHRYFYNLGEVENREEAFFNQLYKVENILRTCVKLYNEEKGTNFIVEREFRSYDPYTEFLEHGYIAIISYEGEIPMVLKRVSDTLFQPMQTKDFEHETVYETPPYVINWDAVKSACYISVYDDTESGPIKEWEYIVNSDEYQESNINNYHSQGHDTVIRFTDKHSMTFSIVHYEDY